MSAEIKQDWQSKLFNLDEALIRLNIDRKQLEAFKLKAETKLEKIPKNMHDEQYLAFLTASPDNIDNAIDRLEVYIDCKLSTPELFRNRDVKCHQVQEALKTLHYALLPTTPDGSFLLLHRLCRYDPNLYNFEDATKVFIMVSELPIFFDGPRPDQTYLFDLRGVSFGHLFKPSIKLIRNGMKFLEDGVPLNVKEIHVLNASSYLNFIIKMIRPFSRSKILERIHFHSSDIDWDEFYKNHIPKTHLPSDYGGDLESIELLHAKTHAKLMEAADYFEYEENLVFSQ